LSEKINTPFFFSQKKSGKKEKGRTAAYQDKFSIRRGGLKFPKRLKKIVSRKFFNAQKFQFVAWHSASAEMFFSIFFKLRIKKATQAAFF